ncbi:MAG TPA: hypothetical protein VL069_05395, partial [Opitutus sp.]|nr:hypothetical protein [Opitutus sp.]
KISALRVSLASGFRKRRKARLMRKIRRSALRGKQFTRQFLAPTSEHFAMSLATVALKKQPGPPGWPRG